jgi:hypothetical protein
MFNIWSSDVRRRELTVTRLLDQVRFAVAWLTTSRELLRQGKSFRDVHLIRRARKWLSYTKDELEYKEEALLLEISLI